ncbi:hypothetical protein BDDG_07857 [Blastomyces dermatitidis ATCC 18188]|uniref:Cyclin-D1-binding protein 1-like N-terminal domain-containing protein n=1 Tax=Ajellomyces dermatitidis (strain ATCC 18188 / CBS 674.68) TaxID=653446 RepID=F2TNU9_AJEDA|nr:hypothetical protein BDDG_07857 [Blastomyces dermatitidis ATCC 18188]
MPPTLSGILEATLIITDQFHSTLSIPLPQSESQPSNVNSNNPAPLPLPLLSASAAALKAQTTKLSLLAVNTPFTPSALITVLSTVNESILPSLVTAALLAVPTEYTQAFHAEAKLLVKDAFKEFGNLVGVVKVIADSGGSGDEGKGVTVTEQQKGEVMSCTGRLWKTCEQLVSFAEGGVVGFVAGKARQYLELVKDGIRELEEWDPEEEEDDDEDGLFWDDGDELGGKAKEKKEKDKASDESNDDEETTSSIANLQSEKSNLLRLLNPIAQIYPAIISHRLKSKISSSSSTSNDRKQNYQPNSILSSAQISQVNLLLQRLKELPNLVDEAAGSLYDHDIDNVTMYTKQLCKCAFSAAEVARSPFIESVNGETEIAGEEDKFPKWADTWMRVIDGITRSKAEGS